MPPSKKAGKNIDVVVIGAGAFGGWTALALLRGGARVTLLDPWGPGHSRSSSGGEHRVIRATYGPNKVYTEWVVRALALWQENERRWGRQLYHRTGVLWMLSGGVDDSYEKAAVPVMEAAGVPIETLTPAEVAGRYPQLDASGVDWAIWEKEAGYLDARAACAVVAEEFVKEGGVYRQLPADPGAIEGGEMHGIKLPEGETLTADQYVFACGPWLPKLFPDVIAPRVQVSRQEVYFFGPPAGESHYETGAMPVWADHGPRFYYGIPAHGHRGFKIADDTRGADFDPTSTDRRPTPAEVDRARDYLAHRFPGLKDAPLVESRVCQYSNTGDGHFIIDRHPRAENVWIVGGGSGHGFKHGPVIGETVAAWVKGKERPDPFFGLQRFHDNDAAASTLSVDIWRKG